MGVASAADIRAQYSQMPRQAVISESNPYTSKTGIGVEIEVERVRNHYDRLNDDIKLSEITPYWNVTTDGSLRDGGLEFVSWVGMNVQEVMEGVIRLNKLFQQFGCDFSPRCGLHVHFVFNGSTIESVKNFFMLYGLFENSIFSISGNRRTNKFCCPVRESHTGFAEFLQQDENKALIRDILRNGQKYLAFNYKPLGNYGTIEFRHHYGTGVAAVIGNWINTIDSMYAYAHNKTFDELKAEITSLNTISSYEAFAERVFGKLAQQFNQDDLRLDMREGCRFIKECLTVSDIQPAKQPAPPSFWDEVTINLTAQGVAQPAPQPVPNADALEARRLNIERERLMQQIRATTTTRTTRRT